MPRRPCPKRIAHQPPCDYFKPAGIPLRTLREITLLAEEAEAIRLADCMGLYRADAAAQMGIARQTFDRIIRRARQKIACVLTQGAALRIERRQPAEGQEVPEGGFEPPTKGL